MIKQLNLRFQSGSQWESMFYDFTAYNFEDFKKNYLFIEKDLDKTPQIRLGELSRVLTKTNLDVAKKLNNWASDIFSKVSKYIKKLQKRSEVPISIRTIPVGDKTEAAAIIVIKIGSADSIETSIFDNNKIVIKMSEEIARVINRGKLRKFMSNKDRVSDYLIGILERVVNDIQDSE